jgi:hypothetical protein
VTCGGATGSVQFWDVASGTYLVEVGGACFEHPLRLNASSVTPASMSPDLAVEFQYITSPGFEQCNRPAILGRPAAIWPGKTNPENSRYAE